jgi:hypothetical protein
LVPKKTWEAETLSTDDLSLVVLPTGGPERDLSTGHWCKRAPSNRSAISMRIASRSASSLSAIGWKRRNASRCWTTQPLHHGRAGLITVNFFRCPCSLPSTIVEHNLAQAWSQLQIQLLFPVATVVTIVATTVVTTIATTVVTTIMVLTFTSASPRAPFVFFYRWFNMSLQVSFGPTTCFNREWQQRRG